MNWFTKKSIKHITQAFLLIFSSLNGFMWMFLSIFNIIGLPINGWTIMSSLVLGVSSTWGLLYWINNY